MEEKLINAVKNHELLYNRSLLLYRNKNRRAAAWSSISKELNLPEDVCQARWKSLRDKYVKKVSELQRASSSGAEITESQWQHKEQMDFLREHVQTRKSTSSIKLENGSEVSPSSQMDNDRQQSVDSLTDALFEVHYCEEQPESSIPLNSDSGSMPFEVSSSYRKRARRESESEAFIEFLKRMTVIAENRFAVPPATRKSTAHDGFFAMVDEIFDDLPSDVVSNAKFFFINYLRDQMAATKKW